jgi:hypothetical protein
MQKAQSSGLGFLLSGRHVTPGYLAFNPGDESSALTQCMNDRGVQMALVDDMVCEGATQSPKRLERAGYPLPAIPNSRSREMVEESYFRRMTY